MAARDDEITAPADDWVEATDGAVTGNTTAAVIVGPLIVRATATATKPSGEWGWPLTETDRGWSGKTLADLFPGVPNAQHLWVRSARPGGSDAKLAISHG